MTIAFWCVLAAALLPLLATGFAKFSGSGFNISHNNSPRDFLESLEGKYKRAHWAQINSFEAFPPFAAAVIIAQYIGVMSQLHINIIAISFVAIRFIYIFTYIFNLSTLRTFVWFSGWVCIVSLFVLSI